MRMSAFVEVSKHFANELSFLFFLNSMERILQRYESFSCFGKEDDQTTLGSNVNEMV